KHDNLGHNAVGRRVARILGPPPRARLDLAPDRPPQLGSNVDRRERHGASPGGHTSGTLSPVDAATSRNRSQPVSSRWSLMRRAAASASPALIASTIGTCSPST